MSSKRQRAFKDRQDQRKRLKNPSPLVVSGSVVSKGSGWSGDNQRKKAQNTALRERSVFIRLEEISKIYTGLEVDEKDMVLSYDGNVRDYGVLVSGGLLVDGKAFDLEKVEGRNSLVSFLGLGSVEEKGSTNGEVYDLFEKVVKWNAHLRFKRKHEIFLYKELVYRCRAEDSLFFVQTYGGERDFDLRKEGVGKNLVSFLKSRKKD